MRMRLHIIGTQLDINPRLRTRNSWLFSDFASRPSLAPGMQVIVVLGVSEPSVWIMLVTGIMAALALARLSSRRHNATF
jgi:hypothetical protein